MRSYENKNGRDALNSFCKTDSCSEKSECFSYKIWIEIKAIFFLKKFQLSNYYFSFSIFRRWMLSGPETTRLLHQFDGQYQEDSDEHGGRLNHEMGLSAQKTFKQQVNNLVDVVRKMGNPFLDDFPELVTLDSRDCAGDDVAKAVMNLGTLGQTQYKEYVKAVIEDRTISIHNTIKRNNIPLYKKQPLRNKSKQTKKIAALQNNVALFAQLYIAMQSRNADLEEFFSHEVQPFPPSLSEFGNLRLPSAKSELLKCLIPSTQAEPPTQFDCSVLDGAVVVHCLPVTGSNTFDDYAHNVFIPHLSRQRSTRVDVVWDTYIPNSLKQSTREKRGKGVRRKVDGGTKLPFNWMSFLRDPLNKEELFHFLSLKVARHSWPERKTIHVTSGKYATHMSAMVLNQIML